MGFFKIKVSNTVILKIQIKIFWEKGEKYFIFIKITKTIVLLSSSPKTNNANKNKRNNSEDHRITKVLNIFIMKARERKKLTANNKKGFLKIKTFTK